MSQISRETHKDEILKILKSVILEGWPENRSQLYTKVQDFGIIEMTCQDTRT